MRKLPYVASAVSLAGILVIGVSIGLGGKINVWEAYVWLCCFAVWVWLGITQARIVSLQAKTIALLRERLEWYIKLP